MTFLLCDPGLYVHKPDVQKKWDDNTHTHTETSNNYDKDGQNLDTFRCCSSPVRNTTESWKVYFREVSRKCGVFYM